MECKDIELLKRVIQNDKDAHVRKAAKQRIEDLTDGELNGQGAYAR